MQTEIYKTIEVLEQLGAYPEWEPFLNTIISKSSHVDFSTDDNSTLIASFFEECMAKIKEYKATINSQEEELQNTNEELVMLREENGTLDEVSQNLGKQIEELKVFLNEADTMAQSLREEIANNKQEKEELYEIIDKYEAENRELASRLSDKQEKSPDRIRIYNEETGEEEQIDKFIETIDKQYNQLQVLEKEIEELQGYKEKYEDLSKKFENIEILKDKNAKLQEDLNLITEEYRKVVFSTPNNLMSRYWESLEETDKKQDQRTLASELEDLENLPKEDDVQNKNFLMKKSLSITTPNKENLCIQKQSLLSDAMLINSNEPLQGSISVRKDSNNRPKDLQVVNLNKVFQNEHTVNGASLGATEETQMESTEWENKKGIKSGLGLQNEDSDSKRSGRGLTERKVEGNFKAIDTSLERNGELNTMDFYLEGMLSWEEGDFPRLGGSSGFINTPNTSEAKAKKSHYFSHVKSQLKDLASNEKGLLLTESNFKSHKKNSEEIEGSDKKVTEKNDSMRKKTSNKKKYGTVKKIKEDAEDLIEQIDSQPVQEKEVAKELVIVKPVCEERCTQTEETKEKKVEEKSKEVENINKNNNKWRKNPKMATWIAFIGPIFTSFILVFLVFYFRITKKC